jgi:hypothetical protein
MKHMKTLKKDFQTPEVSIVLLDTEDILTTSADCDAVDNWASDIFV